MRRATKHGFTLIELMIVVAIIGVLAAIAIPSFTKSVRRARTSEAMIGLRKIYDGSVAYFDNDHTNPQGDIVPRMFPVSENLTPQNPDCPGCAAGVPPPGIRANPRPTDWDAPTWRALTFGVSDPYYYVYGYRSGGTGNEAGFEGFAFGDLDGDGVLSTFLRGGEVHEHGVRGYGGVARINELE